LKILYFDCFSGISGDMTIGALLDLGIDAGRFRQELSKLNLEGFELHIERRLSRGIAGTDVNVVLTQPDDCRERGGHGHDGREHGYTHDHGYSHDYGHEHHARAERNLDDILAIIDGSGLSQRVKDFSRRVFSEIAAAEARVHGKPVGEVHFHEVGAVDSIIDITGTAICLELLGVDRVYASPLHDGNGFIECRHGIIPVPVPAVVEMLAGSGIPLISEDVPTELVTPTGMGIIKCLAGSFGARPAMKIEKTGYGIGKRETGRLNALRILMGEPYGEAPEGDEVAVLETNIDDASPEIIGYTAERLFEKGALDVFYTPVYMKKNRPAYMLTVLARPQDEELLAGVILTETTTLGIRKSLSKRYCMERRTVTVTTPYGDARVKIASGGAFRKGAPEYEDCRKLALLHGIPIARIYEAVMENAKGQYGL
jgi:uncharacterized protein (TIGR00299 family) protein